MSITTEGGFMKAMMKVFIIISGLMMMTSSAVYAGMIAGPCPEDEVLLRYLRQIDPKGDDPDIQRITKDLRDNRLLCDNEHIKVLEAFNYDEKGKKICAAPTIYLLPPVTIRPIKDVPPLAHPPGTRPPTRPPLHPALPTTTGTTTTGILNPFITFAGNCDLYNCTGNGGFTVPTPGSQYTKPNNLGEGVDN